MSTNKPQPSPRQLAERIAEELFTTKDEDPAMFLVQVDRNWKEVGSMNRATIEKRIAKILEAAGREA